MTSVLMCFMMELADDVSDDVLFCAVFFPTKCLR